MKHVHLESSAKNSDYMAALALARLTAAGDPEMEQPVLLAWHDRKARSMSPAIAGANTDTRWRDYGESHGGSLEIDVDGDYDFIFTDSASFDSYGPSPYANLADAEGQEYLCQISALRDPHRPDSAACVPLDDYTSKLT